MNRRKFLSAMLSSGLTATPWQAYAMQASPDPDVRFLRPTDADYQHHQGLFNTRIQHHPALIAVCQTETGVQKAVMRARAQGLAVAVRSGGHSYEGYSSNDGGMCVDLGLMNWLRLTSAGRVMAGPSTRLIQVYEKLMPMGRLLPTGSCATVALGGITLGGGYGLFSREHGLGCDWLRHARMVDGHGTVHVVEDETELMWALRGGGGGGLGIVTALVFDSVACPMSICSYRFKAFNQSSAQLVKLIGNWFDVVAQLPRHAFSACVISASTLTILVTSTASKPDDELLEVLARLGSYADKIYPPQEQSLPEGIRGYYGQQTPSPVRNASAGFYRNYSEIESVIGSIADIIARHPGLVLQINTLGGAIDDPVPGNHSVYAHRGHPFLGQIKSDLSDPARAAALMAAVNKVQGLFATAGVTRHYANYADGELANWQQAYYGTSGYQRLRKIKQRLDPENLFRHPQSIAGI